MTKETGGQAFPNDGFNGWGLPEKGMTLRDYFAGNALQGYLAAPDLGWSEDELAVQAYKQADRMLEARK